MSTVTPTQRVVLVARRRGATVLTHRQWESKEQSTYIARRKLTKEGHWPGFKLIVNTVVFHITVTFDSGILTGDFKADCQTVERIGKQRFNSGVSYNWLIDMETGAVAVGQPMDSKGTHTINDKHQPNFSDDQNLVARAIGYIGMPGKKLSDAAVESTVDVLVAMWEAGYLADDPDMLPHSFFAAKDCPTDAVRERMPEIQRRYRARIRRAKEGRKVQR
jgi:hypothetical protein